jgi:hypothetical protein
LYSYHDFDNKTGQFSCQNISFDDESLLIVVLNPGITGKNKFKLEKFCEIDLIFWFLLLKGT